MCVRPACYIPPQHGALLRLAQALPSLAAELVALALFVTAVLSWLAWTAAQ